MKSSELSYVDKMANFYMGERKRKPSTPAHLNQAWCLFVIDNLNKRAKRIANDRREIAIYRKGAM